MSAGEQVPETKYARSADGTKLAYQVTGDGPLDLVVLHGLAVPVDLMRENPGLVRISKRLGSFSRTIWRDTRGSGASEGDRHGSDNPEVADEDLIAVLDAVGSEQAVLLGYGLSGSSAIRFSATHPERVSALVLVNTWAHYVREDDYPLGMTPTDLERFVAFVKETWGTGAFLELPAPSRAADERFQAWFARTQRLGVGPDESAEMFRVAFEGDVRPLLSSVRVPTLVLHRAGNRFIQLGAGQYLAEHIPGAKLVVLPGDDHIFYVGDSDALVDEIEEFLTGRHQAPEGEVVTTTILFTDIVKSTEQSVQLGHRRWTTLIHDHDAMVRATLQRHRGREIRTMGDAFLATFDATTRALRAATEIVIQARTMGLEVRAGVHTGEVEVRSDDVVGVAVAIAKRICDLSGPGQMLVSEVVKFHLVGSGLAVVEHGTHVLKGVPDEWRLFAVET
jgi:class 3 adenylate cyclase